MQLALRIEVDSLAAAQNLPGLLEILARHQAGASFYINLGPDRSGQARGPLFTIGNSRPQQKRNRQQTHPGGWAHGYGRWWLAPVLANRIGPLLRSVQHAGHEIGILAWDSVQLRKQVQAAPQSWFATELAKAAPALAQMLGQPASASAAPYWQISAASLRAHTQAGLQYASDTRGSHPFMPVIDGEPMPIVQIPTTLPTLLELDGDPVSRLLAQTAHPQALHVFTISALQAARQAALFEQLLQGWQAQGYALVSLATVYAALTPQTLPWHCIEQARWPGYAMPLAKQGISFP